MKLGELASDSQGSKELGEWDKVVEIRFEEGKKKRKQEGGDRCSEESGRDSCREVTNSLRHVSARDGEGRREE